MYIIIFLQSYSPQANHSGNQIDVSVLSQMLVIAFGTRMNQNKILSRKYSLKLESLFKIWVRNSNLPHTKAWKNGRNRI